MFTSVAAFHTPTLGDGTARKTPDPTPVVFPQFAPQAEDHPPLSSRAHPPLVALLQTIQRPADIKLEHFEALGLHVISNASPQHIIPDSSYLPPVDRWLSIGEDDKEAATIASKKPLSNGNLSPGMQTYLERRNELSIDNTAAFRTIRRIPAPTGEAAVRLGNAYEFFKNLELLSGYWIDTSLPPKPAVDPSSDAAKKEREEEEAKPPHLRTHQRSGTGSQLPPEYRQHLITAFIKLVAYDFGCNVSFPRVEPRLHLTSTKPATPSSYFNSSPTFIYRTPIDRASARSGVVEGPIAVVSCRTSTVFSSLVDERLDLAREVIAVLLTAQQRAREHKTERRFGDGQWWTTKPRWGGGTGGAIGREADKPPTDAELPLKMLMGGAEEELDVMVKEVSQAVTERIGDVKRAIGGINGPSPSKKSKKGSKDGAGKGNMAIYENYRKMLPPSSNWDRKARYSAVGKVQGAGYDDIFLVSALNHHVSLVRVRVPDKLLGVLDGEGGDEGWARVEMWRSKWYDLFLTEERIEAMGVVWGMMAWLMRATPEPAPEEGNKTKEGAQGRDEMDVS